MSKVKKEKVLLTMDILKDTPIAKIGTIVNGALVGGYIDGFDHKSPGFYFLVKDGKVYARFYQGRRTTHSGFNLSLSLIRSRRSKVCEQICDLGTFDVYHLDHLDSKNITNAYGKTAFRKMTSRRYKSEYQTLEELNRIMHSHFKFVLQNR